MKVLGIAGKKGVGKDTIANYLVNNYGFVKVAYADKVKDVARSLGWDGKKDERGRRLLQRLGTDVAREYDIDIWVKATFKVIGVMSQLYDKFVIPDVRFQNEVDAIHESGGLVILIGAKWQDNKDSHPSERELNYIKNFDHYVENIEGKPLLLLKSIYEILTKVGF